MPSIYHIPQPITAYAASSSTVTSNPFLVQDYNTISVSVVSNTTILSLVVQGSNDDGLQPVGGPYGTVAAQAWSTITTLLTQGIFSITPGMRWLRFGSPVSACTVILAGAGF